MPKAPKPIDVMPSVTPTEVFIVNKAGAVHSVEPADVAVLLERPGFRLATPGEIAVYRSTPIQEATDPIGKRGL